MREDPKVLTTTSCGKLHEGTRLIAEHYGKKVRNNNGQSAGKFLNSDQMEHGKPSTTWWRWVHILKSVWA